MASIALSFASSRHDGVVPLMDGTVQPEGVELVPIRSSPSETFWRQLKFGDFEISEMSISSYLMARAQGSELIAIPAFPSRQFFQNLLWYNTDSGIRQPGDVAGKRWGVPEYQQTAVLWARGILEHDFGVSQFSVDWWMERTEALSHAGITGLDLPEGIRFHRVADDDSLAAMLVSNRLDVILAFRDPWSEESSMIDRGAQRASARGDWSRVKQLFPDPIAEGTRFYKEHGFIPVNHTYAIRGDVHQRYPWLAFNLYAAFLKAKEIAMREVPQELPTSLVWGREYLRQTRAALAPDPFPYGVSANRAMLQTIIDYSFEQGLTKRKLEIEELFAPSTLDL
jgi:4,5-dihydroxyphthalate decarboxylase